MKNALPRRPQARQSGGLGLEFKTQEIFQRKGACHCLQNGAKKKATQKVQERRRKLQVATKAVAVLRQHSARRKTRYDDDAW